MTIFDGSAATAFPALLALVAPAWAQQGDWAGWMYLDDGDIPVRLHVEGPADELSTQIDLPSNATIGVRLGSTRVDGNELVIAHPSADDPGIRLAIDLGGGDPRNLRGEVAWNGSTGTIHLHRAEAPLAWEAPAIAAEAVGLYGSPEIGGGPALLVRQQPWGELVLVDPIGGAERTLFPRAPGDYVVGPALYVPAPIEREITLERGPDGAVCAILVTTAEGTRRSPRVDVRTEEIALERDGVTLAGTLTLPRALGWPLAVIGGGGVWTDRSRVRSYALMLAAFGVGSVIFDKRGYGGSGGERDGPFETTAGDLRGFADAARVRPDVDAAMVGYMGLSRGAWFGAIAAGGDPDAAFFVSIVGPAVSPLEQETTSRLDRMGAAGASDADLALGEEYLHAMCRYSRTGGGGERYLELRDQVGARGWLSELLGPPTLDPPEWEWFRINGDFDQRSALRALRCPTLALFGEDDLSVAARVNAPLMRDALWFAGVEPVRVIVMPRCDHGLQEVVRDAQGVRRPFHLSPGIHPAVWPTVGAFLNEL